MHILSTDCAIKEETEKAVEIPLPVDNFSEMCVAEPYFICNFTA